MSRYYNVCVESMRAEMTSRNEACALSTAAKLNHVMTSSLCDVNVTSSSSAGSGQWRIPFVACNLPPLSTRKPSLTGHNSTDSLTTYTSSSSSCSSNSSDGNGGGSGGSTMADLNFRQKGVYCVPFPAPPPKTDN